MFEEMLSAADEKMSKLAIELDSYEKKIGKMKKLVHALAKGAMNGLVIAGTPGIGKTHNITETLAQYEDLNVNLVKGHITPFAVFNMMAQYSSENDIHVFDDADSAFANVASLNLLKAATDSYPERRISWISPANMNEQSIVFKGKIVIITNQLISRSPHYNALLDRMFFYELNVSYDEKLAKILDIASADTTIPDEVKTAVYEYFMNNPTEDFSIRYYNKIMNFVNVMGVDSDWEDVVKSAI